MQSFLGHKQLGQLFDQAAEHIRLLRRFGSAFMNIWILCAYEIMARPMPGVDGNRTNRRQLLAVAGNGKSSLLMKKQVLC